MADPTPNLALEELRKKKEPKRKKENSPGTSPPRALNGASPKSKPDSAASSGDKPEQTQAKSPAYSDISDDNDDDKKDSAKKPAADPRLPLGASFPFPPYGLPQGSLPTVPVSASTVKPAVPAGSPKPDLAKDALAKLGSGPQPGSLEYQKMLQAYGFPPMPYPIPPGMDPNLHIHLLGSDPSYKAKHERERAEKEKAFKDQIDRDNREKDRKAGVTSQGSSDHAKVAKTPEDLSRKQLTPSAATGTLSVKPEFNLKSEQSVKPEPVKKEEEGAKPTMETRGPPPGTNAYGYIHPSMIRPGVPGLPYDLGLNPLLLGAAAGQYNPYLPPHLQGPAAAAAAAAAVAGAAGASAGIRPPFGATSVADLLRSPFLPPTSTGTLPEDLSRPASASGALSSTKALDLID